MSPSILFRKDAVLSNELTCLQETFGRIETFVITWLQRSHELDIEISTVQMSFSCSGRDIVLSPKNFSYLVSRIAVRADNERLEIDHDQIARVWRKVLTYERKRSQLLQNDDRPREISP